MVKSVLLSGASGFVGSAVLAYLLEHTDWEFTCPCSWRHRGNPLNIDPTNSRVRVVTHDLTAPLPDLGQFDFIISMASESHVCHSIKDPVNFIMNNVALTLSMLDYARLYKPEVFINFGTDESYGAVNHNDWDVLLPSNPYAASKAAQEMVCISYFKTYGVPVVLTNSNNIIGPGQNAEKFVPKVIDLVKRDQEVTIHVAADGKPGKRHYNPVQNIAAALHFILDITPLSYPASDRPDRYSLPGGEELDNLEIVKLIAKALGKELKYKLVDAETVRPGYDAFYPRTEGGLLINMGFWPQVSCREELERIVRLSCLT